MLIPFIVAPVVLTLISTATTCLGLVPAVAQYADRTVPILLSGYKATGSAAGSILQLFNVIIGVLIYILFVRQRGRKETEKFTKAVRQLELDMAEGEKTGNIRQWETPWG